MKLLTTIIVGIIILLISLSGGCSRDKPRSASAPTSKSPGVVSKTTDLATISEEEGPDEPAAGSGHFGRSKADSQPPVFAVLFNDNGTGVAYIARVGERVRVVLNGRPGKLYDEIESYTLTVSPDGQRVAYGARLGDKWYPVVDGVEKGPFVIRGRLSFSPDSRHAAYEAQVGDKWYMFVDDKKNKGAVSYYERAVFSSDSSRLMYVENTKEDGVYLLVISDLAFSRQSVRTIGDPLVRVSSDNTKIAAIEKKGNKQRVVVTTFGAPDSAKEGAWYDEIKHPAFSGDGNVIAYLAKKEGKHYLVLTDKEELLPEGNYPAPPVVRPDNLAAGVVIEAKEGTYVYQAFKDKGKKGNLYKECGDLVYNKDGTLHAYVAIKNERFLIVVNDMEGPFFDRVISPVFSPDGRYLVYRARKEGKRFVVLADAKGRVLRQYEGYERVFQPVFTPDGKAVAYGVKDGNKLIWKVDDLEQKK